MRLFRSFLCVLILVLGARILSAQDEPKIATRYHSEFQSPYYQPQSMVYDQQGRPYLYVAAKSGGLLIFDASDPKNLLEQGRFASNNFLRLQVMDVNQEGNFLYVALGNTYGGKQAAGLGIVDITNPKKPFLISVWMHDQKGRGASTVSVKGDYAYLSAMNFGVIVLNIKDKRKITLETVYIPDIHFPKKDPSKFSRPTATSLALFKDKLYLTYGTGGVRILDITNPKTPKQIGQYINPQKGINPHAYNSIVVTDSLAYVSSDYCGMEILNISNPSQIEQVGWWNPWNCHTTANTRDRSLGHSNQLVLDQKRNLVFLAAGDSELQLLDVTKSTEPTLVGSFGYPTDRLSAWGLTVHEQYVFLSYVQGIGLPFDGIWSGIKVVEWAEK